MENNTIKIKTEKEQLIKREYFIEITGVFVSPLYFEYIYEYQLEEYIKKGLPIDEVIHEWLEENECMIVETEFGGKFQYLFEDDTICSMDIEKPTALDIINWIVESHDELHLRKDEISENMHELISYVRKLIKVFDYQQEAFNIVFDKYQEDIVKDTFLEDRLSLCFSNIHNTLKDKSLLSEDEYKKAEFMTEEEKIQND